MTHSLRSIAVKAGLVAALGLSISLPAMAQQSRYENGYTGDVYVYGHRNRDSCRERKNEATAGGAVAGAVVGAAAGSLPGAVVGAVVGSSVAREGTSCYAGYRDGDYGYDNRYGYDDRYAYDDRSYYDERRDGYGYDNWHSRDHYRQDYYGNRDRYYDRRRSDW